MSGATPEEVVRYRIERARRTLREADILAQDGSWNACVNRLYYACFYATTALLMKDGRNATKHTGVRGFLNQYYVHTGLIAKDLGSFYNALFDSRHDSDYEDFFEFEEAAVRPLMLDAQRFVERVAALLQLPEQS